MISSNLSIILLILLLICQLNIIKSEEIYIFHLQHQQSLINYYLNLSSHSFGYHLPKHYYKPETISEPKEGQLFFQQLFKSGNLDVELGLEYEVEHFRIGSMNGFWKVTFRNGMSEGDIEMIKQRNSRIWSDQVLYFQKEEKRELYHRSGSDSSTSDSASSNSDPSSIEYNYNDPLYNQEWFLFPSTTPTTTTTTTTTNTDTESEIGNFHIDTFWNKNLTGKNITIAIVDDGLDFQHFDLKHAFLPELSWDFQTNAPLQPPSVLGDHHGTRCAGQIFALPNNSVCTVGLAYHSKMVGIKLIGGSVSDRLEALALSHHNSEIEIYSSSWGPSDDGKAIDGPKYFLSLALRESIVNGRRGLGSLYVFASGNGGWRDGCGYDGYVNSRYTVTVGAVTKTGGFPYYGEMCAGVLVSGYSGGSGVNEPLITTTDISINCQSSGSGTAVGVEGTDCCTGGHSGTSASTPFISALIALVLELRHDLHWRDVQEILLKSTLKNDPEDGEWQMNGSGRWVSHKYGYGVVDSKLLLNSTLNHESLPGSSFISKSIGEGRVFTDVLRVEYLFNTSQLLGSENISSVEHVEMTLTLKTAARGRMRISLISPSGTQSILIQPRPNDHSTDGLTEWTLMSVRHWGESIHGQWTLLIEDLRTAEERRIVDSGSSSNGWIFGSRNQSMNLLESAELKIWGIACPRQDWIPLSNNSSNGKYQCPWELELNQLLIRHEQEWIQLLTIGTIVGGLLVCLSALGMIYWFVWRRRRFGRRKLVQSFSLESLKYLSEPLNAADDDDERTATTSYTTNATATATTTNNITTTNIERPLKSVPLLNESISRPLSRSASLRKLDIGSMRTLDLGLLPSPQPMETFGRATTISSMSGSGGSAVVGSSGGSDSGGSGNAESGPRGSPGVLRKSESLGRLVGKEKSIRESSRLNEMFKDE